MVNVMTQNIMCTPEMRQEFVKFDTELTSMQSDIILWQEIQIERYVQAVNDLNLLGFASYNGMDKGGAPISWRRSMYEFIDGGEKTMYLTTPGISRTRKVVWVKLRHLRTGKVVVVINAHFVTGMGTSLIRTQLWKRCRRVLLKVVSRFVNQGFACIVGGDYNRHNFRVLGSFFELEDGTRRTVMYPVPEDEIDQLMFINGEDLVFGSLVYEKENGRHSDHQGNRVNARIRKRS